MFQSGLFRSYFNITQMQLHNTLSHNVHEFSINYDQNIFRTF